MGAANITEPFIPHALHVESAIKVNDVRRDESQIIVVIILEQLLNSIALIQGPFHNDLAVVILGGDGADRAHPIALAKAISAERVAKDNGEFFVLVDWHHDAKITGHGSYMI